jgi:hypothetical protein
MAATENTEITERERMMRDEGLLFSSLILHPSLPSSINSVFSVTSVAKLFCWRRNQEHVSEPVHLSLGHLTALSRRAVRAGRGKRPVWSHPSERSIEIG